MYEVTYLRTLHIVYIYTYLEWRKIVVYSVHARSYVRSRYTCSQLVPSCVVVVVVVVQSAGFMNSL